MQKKCAACGILLDIPCTNSACDGHCNTSAGEVCLYCATNERTTTRASRGVAYPLRSALADLGHGEE